MNNQQKVVIITGGAQGIGEGLIRGYRKRNYQVVATSRFITRGSYEGVHTVEGDISKRETADYVVREVLERFGRIDTLLNNTGVLLAKPFIDFTQEDYDHSVTVNIAGFFHITQRVAKEMLKQGSGHIVNITTSLVNQPITGVPAALASLTKGGLNAVTQELAIEFATTGVRVNAVSPGIIKTPMNPPSTHEFLSAPRPVGRMGEIRDIVDAVLYLEGTSFVTGEILYLEGASFVTGEILQVDGE